MMQKTGAVPTYRRNPKSRPPQPAVCPWELFTARPSNLKIPPNQITTKIRKCVLLQIAENKQIKYAKMVEILRI